MTATLYVGFLRTTEIIIEVTEDDVLRGYARRQCPDCEGTGIVDWVPDSSPETCVMCKGQKIMLINC